MILHAARSRILPCLHGFIAAFLLLGLTATAPAQDATPMEKTQAALEAMQKAAIPGPKDIPLGNHASIALPENFVFIPKAEATHFMRAVGNTVDNDFIGLIFGDQIDGFVAVEFSPTGYIKDDDAKNWDVDELLDSLKEGTKHANKEREKLGIPALEVIGWIEKPAYDASAHRLVWSVAARNAGAEGDEQGVNYNTYLLGRKGYLSLNLISDTTNIEQEKPLAKTLLAAVNFNPGERYQDFNAATDTVAEYGLAALVGGLAAKKLGLLAVIGVFLAKFWKLILIGVFAFGAIFSKFFKRKTTA